MSLPVCTPQEVLYVACDMANYVVFMMLNPFQAENTPKTLLKSYPTSQMCTFWESG